VNLPTLPQETLATLLVIAAEQAGLPPPVATAIPTLVRVAHPLFERLLSGEPIEEIAKSELGDDGKVIAGLVQKTLGEKP
jgi:hypothetical protein